MLKALIISDDKGKFRDVGDILAVARAQGQKVFKTHQNVQVIEIFNSLRGYYVAVVSFEAGYPGSADENSPKKRALDRQGGDVSRNFPPFLCVQSGSFQTGPVAYRRLFHKADKPILRSATCISIGRRGGEIQ